MGESRSCGLRRRNHPLRIEQRRTGSFGTYHFQLRRIERWRRDGVSMKSRSLDFLGYPAYIIDSEGNVWSNLRGGWKKLKPGLMGDHKKYLGVSLCNKGKRKTIKIHRLVLEAFVGPCPEGYEARHFPDPNPYNNRLENLQWATHKDNEHDKIIHGTKWRAKGELHGNSKLTKENVLEIRKLKKSKKLSNAKIGKRFGVSRAAIGLILTRKRWTHLKETDE